MHVLRKEKQVVNATGDPQDQGFPPTPPTQHWSERCRLHSGPVTKRLPPCPELPAALLHVGDRLFLLDSKTLDGLCMSWCQSSASQSVQVEITANSTATLCGFATLILS